MIQIYYDVLVGVVFMCIRNIFYYDSFVIKRDRIIHNDDKIHFFHLEDLKIHEIGHDIVELRLTCPGDSTKYSHEPALRFREEGLYPILNRTLNKKSTQKKLLPALKSYAVSII